MAMVKLDGLYKVTAKGRTYYYAWRGGPRIQAAHGTPAFAAEFAAHHAARKGGDKGKVSELIVDWKRSPAWTAEPANGGLAHSTRKNWKGPLDEIQLHFGKLRVNAFEEQKTARRNIKAWLKKWDAKPRTRDMHKQVLSALLTYAVDEDRLGANPCFGIKNAYGSDRADVIWTEEDIMALAGAASPELMYAIGLACLTGLRQTDLLRLTWSDVDALAVEKRTGKGTRRGRGRKVATIPLYDELRTLLAVIPKRSPVILTNSEGFPWKSGFTSSWNKAMRASGLHGKLHFHDARGTFATTAYGLDVLSVAEIAEMLAWSEEKVERIIKRYVNREAILRDKIRRIAEARENAAGTASAKRLAKPVAKSEGKS